MALAYRCAACEAEDARCPSCRTRRAAAVKRGRAAKRAAGACTECAAAAAPGLTRCRRHADDNTARSGAAHIARRARGAP
jgi:hypothetical protein